MAGKPAVRVGDEFAQVLRAACKGCAYVRASNRERAPSRVFRLKLNGKMEICTPLSLERKLKQL
jgi:hypothetical protein